MSNSLLTVNVANAFFSQVKGNPSTLLRDMLKSPYCTSKSKATAYSTVENDSNMGTLASSHTNENRTVERLPSGITAVNAGQNDSKSPVKSSVSKSVSSLASSSYHAKGYLPPYEGAGKAHASSILHSSGRVNDGQSPLHDDVNEAISKLDMTSTCPEPAQDAGLAARPAPIGLDGSGDAPDSPASQSSEQKASNQKKPVFDTMGVTRADFDIRRPDHMNPEHQAAVNEFFRDLHKREMKKITATKRRNNKTT